MSCRKIYLLEDEEEEVTKELVIHQEFEAEEGGVVWDCALILVAYFEKCFTKHLFPFNGAQGASEQGGGKWRVLELGSGTGIVGLAFSRLMAMKPKPGSLVLSDRVSQIPLIDKNIEVNQLSSTDDSGSMVDLSTTVLDWSVTSQVQSFFASYTEAFDLILVSDCIYGNTSSEPLALFLERLLLHSPSATIYLSYENRPPHASITRDFGTEFFDFLDNSVEIDINQVRASELAEGMHDPLISVHILRKKE